VFGYGAATLSAASGFLAVYVSAVVLGNARLPHGPATRGFAEGIGWLSQIGLFVLLGLLASPSRLPGQLLSGLVVGVIVVFVARPVSVVLATLPLRLPWRAPAWARPRGARRRDGPSRDAGRGHAVTRVPWRQQAFLSWAGLRGAVPIVLSAIPLSRRVAGATRLFDIVFVVVIAFTLLQGPTLPWAARRLGVMAPAEPLEILVRGRAAGGTARRAAAGIHSAGVPVAWRGAARAAPALDGEPGADRPRRRRVRAGADNSAADR
jgi:cell volume regulation protein A